MKSGWSFYVNFFLNSIRVARFSKVRDYVYGIIQWAIYVYTFRFYWFKQELESAIGFIRMVTLQGFFFKDSKVETTLPGNRCSLKPQKKEDCRVKLNHGFRFKAIVIHHDKYYHREMIVGLSFQAYSFFLFNSLAWELCRLQFLAFKERLI